MSGILSNVEQLRAAAVSCKQNMHDAIERGDLRAATDSAHRLSFISGRIESYASGAKGAAVIAHLKHMKGAA